MKLGKIGSTNMMHHGFTAKDYILDGVIAMWDGIENAGWGIHDEKASTWKDLVGTNNMAFNPLSSHEWTSNSCWQKDITGNYNLGMCYLPYLFFAADFKSQGETIPFIEMVVQVSSAPNYSKLILVNGNSDSGIGTSRNMLLSARTDGRIRTSRIPNLSVWTTGVSITSRMSIAAKNDRLFVNGRICTPTNLQEGWTNVINSGFRIFGGYNNKNYCLLGHLFNVRVHDSVPSDDVIAANYAVDKARFNLP